jgi:hypothetical protein
MRKKRTYGLTKMKSKEAGISRKDVANNTYKGLKSNDLKG